MLPRELFTLFLKRGFVFLHLHVITLFTTEGFILSDMPLKPCSP